MDPHGTALHSYARGGSETKRCGERKGGRCDEEQRKWRKATLQHAAPRHGESDGHRQRGRSETTYWLNTKPNWATDDSMPWATALPLRYTCRPR